MMTSFVAVEQLGVAGHLIRQPLESEETTLKGLWIAERQWSQQRQNYQSVMRVYTNCGGTKL